MNFSSGEQKRKRGRPRKYGADGGMSSGQQDINVPTTQSQTFSPPTALHPLKVQHDSQPLPLPSAQKARDRPPGSSNKKQRVASLGSTGFGFILHVISVKAREGQFDILSLSGSYLLSEVAGQKSRTGGLSITLAEPDGRILGGCVAGLLIAATPVQLVKEARFKLNRFNYYIDSLRELDSSFNHEVQARLVLWRVPGGGVWLAWSGLLAGDSWKFCIR